MPPIETLVVERSRVWRGRGVRRLDPPRAGGSAPLREIAQVQVDSTLAQQFGQMPPGPLARLKVRHQSTFPIPGSRAAHHPRSLRGLDQGLHSSTRSRSPCDAGPVGPGCHVLQRRGLPGRHGAGGARHDVLASHAQRRTAHARFRAGVDHRPTWLLLLVDTLQKERGDCRRGVELSGRGRGLARRAGHLRDFHGGRPPRRARAGRGGAAVSLRSASGCTISAKGWSSEPRSRPRGGARLLPHGRLHAAQCHRRRRDAALRVKVRPPLRVFAAWPRWPVCQRCSAPGPARSRSRRIGRRCASASAPAPSCRSWSRSRPTCTDRRAGGRERAFGHQPGRLCRGPRRHVRDGGPGVVVARARPASSASNCAAPCGPRMLTGRACGTRATTGSGDTRARSPWLRPCAPPSRRS